MATAAPSQLIGLVAGKGSGKTEAEKVLHNVGFAALSFTEPLRTDR